MANRSGWIGAATGRARINLASVEFVLVQANVNSGLEERLNKSL